MAFASPSRFCNLRDHACPTARIASSSRQAAATRKPVKCARARLTRRTRRVDNLLDNASARRFSANSTRWIGRRIAHLSMTHLADGRGDPTAGKSPHRLIRQTHRSQMPRSSLRPAITTRWRPRRTRRPGRRPAIGRHGLIAACQTDAVPELLGCVAQGEDRLGDQVHARSIPTLRRASRTGSPWDPGPWTALAS